MKRHILASFILFTLFLIYLLMPTHILADGMLIRPDPYANRWDYSTENSQQAYINYENSIEKLIISIDMDKSNSGVIWLFPIPAQPDKIAIDVLTSLPSFSGEDISDVAKMRLRDVRGLLLSSQIYTLPFKYLTGFFGFGASNLAMPGRSAILNAVPSTTGKEPDVIVYEHLEKEGMTTEIITAKTANSLYDYSRNKNLNIEKGSIPVLDQYIGRDFSFVASWITPLKIDVSKNTVDKDLDTFISGSYRYPKFSELYEKTRQKYPEGLLRNSNPWEFLNSEDGRTAKEELISGIIDNQEILVEFYGNKNGVGTGENSQRGIFVTFPTNKIYYPLLPTSVYGSKTIPTTIRVIGHVSPEIYDTIKTYAKIKYYKYLTTNFAHDIDNFYTGKEKGIISLDLINYTRIDLGAPSKFLTQDLWISPKTPFKIFYSNFIGDHPTVTAFTLLFFCSAIAGLITSLAVFLEARNIHNLGKYLLLGLSNCFSIIGLIIATYFFKTKQSEIDEVVMNELKQKGYIRRRKIAFIFYVTAVFLIFPLLIISLMGFSYAIFHIYSDRLPVYLIFTFAVLSIPLAIIVFALRMQKIKPEDQYLLEELKAKNYSTFIFQPNEKFGFIIVFSITFIILSMLMVEFIKSTV